MTTQGSAREALIAEALGELGRLLARQEALLPSLDTATRSLLEAQAQLIGRVATLDEQVVALGERIKVQTTKAMVARAEVAGRQLASAHAQALVDAGRAVLRSELAPSLRALLDGAQRPHTRWLSHAAVAVIASTGALLVRTHLCGG